VFQLDERGIRLRPASVLTADERALLAAHLGDIALIAGELRWRLTAMRAQLPTSPTAPLPLVVARSIYAAGDGACVSCAEPTDAMIGRCPLCALAVHLVLAAVPARVIG
jgi:hypothetical protein